MNCNEKCTHPALPGIDVEAVRKVIAIITAINQEMWLQDPHMTPTAEARRKVGCPYQTISEAFHLHPSNEDAMEMATAHGVVISELLALLALNMDVRYAIAHIANKHNGFEMDLLLQTGEEEDLDG